MVFHIIISLASCNPTAKKNNVNQGFKWLDIEPFYAVNQTAGLNDIRAPIRAGADSSVLEYYLINTSTLDSSTIADLDSFSCNLLGKKLANYNQHMITFFIKSERTNNEHLIKNPRELARYSLDNDLLLIYTWFHACNNGLRDQYEQGVAVKSEVINCNCDAKYNKK